MQERLENDGAEELPLRTKEEEEEKKTHCFFSQINKKNVFPPPPPPQKKKKKKNKQPPHYNWSKVDINDPAQKKRVEDMFAEEGTIDGLEHVECKVFK